MKHKKERHSRVPAASEAAAQVHTFLVREDGVTTVEIILIVIVLISLVVLFRDQLTNTVSNILEKINANSQAV